MLCRGNVINRLQFCTPSRVGLIRASETNDCMRIHILLQAARISRESLALVTETRIN